MSVIGSNILAGASGQAGYNLTKSLRFRSSASAYLNRTPASAGNKQTWTLSFWLKTSKSNFDYYIAEASTNSSTDRTPIAFNGGKLQIRHIDGNATQFTIETTQIFRDPSSWYHFVIAVDTTQATSTNRVKFYVNGSQITAFGTASYPTQNLNTDWNGANAHSIGSSTFPDSYADMYLAEFYNIDGQALTPSSFGETSTTTGVWIPKKYTGTYGTNGFYLPFTDTTSTSTLGTDFSGNSNTWTVNNISLTSGSTYDSMTDVPTLTSATTANYAVMNPLRPFGGSLSNGNLTAVTGNTGSANSGVVTSTVWLPTSGKFYFEATPTTVGEIAIGLTTNSNISAALYYRGGDIYINGSVATTQASYTNNDVIGVAVDIGGATVQFYKNNAAQGTAQSISAITAPLVACLAQLSGGGSATANINFGQQPFTYTPPTGFVALNTFNLPTPTIGAGNKQMDVVTYTGDGAASGRNITTSTSPNLAWIKSRSLVANHFLFDSVRGATNVLGSNQTIAEYSNSDFGLGTNQFTVGDNGGSDDYNPNKNAATYVAWLWAAGGTAVTNTAGSITSTVSANTTAGFSIVTYTGTGANATVGHGLGVAPNMVIVKERTNDNGEWFTYHSAFSATQYLTLNSTDALITETTVWNNTAPSSTVFTIGSSDDINGSSDTYVAYVFAQVAGYSAFGSYTGNGSTDGTFVYTGFRPRYLMIKRTDSSNNWVIQDTSRDTYNVSEKDLYADTSGAEATYAAEKTDILSNGFKQRQTGASMNASGGTYIYMAFAENPFKYANAR